LFIVAAAGIAAAEEQAAVEVDDYAFCTNVENHEPINRENTFSSEVGRVYLWNLILAGSTPAQVTHVWYHGDKQMQKETLDIDSASARIWSYMDIASADTGDWYVDIVDCDGNTLKQVSFKVTE